MERTTNYGLYKPGSDDFISVDDLNANMDIIDTELKKASGGGTTAIRAKLRAKSAKGFSAPVEGGYRAQVNIDDLERGDISSSGGNISSNYYLRFKSSAKYELPEGASSIRARVTLASSVSSYTPRFGIAYYDSEDNFLSIDYYFYNNAWSSLPANTAKVRYTISYTNGNGILPEHIEAMTIEAV